MKKFVVSFTFFLIIRVQAQKIELHQPIVANKIADKYIPADQENINGLLGYRMNVNLEKRLLKIDSAILLSGFRKRPGEQTWIGEHVGKFFIFRIEDLSIFS